ncbi:hypothetical protein, partial [Thiocapsa sp.]|uniref:hypothetical protein n=1 Tax=Thiocapsa sp. TaxID=2024551 RepID=UPI0025E54239
LAACIADPGFMELLGSTNKMLADLPAEALEDPRHADPALFAPYMARIAATPALRWKIVQRAFWVHGIDSLPEYLEIARLYSNRQAVRSIRCPVFVAWEEDDALAASADGVYAALEGPKTLARFLAAEGAGDHCAMLGRSLFHQRMFDWLDGVLADGLAASRVVT